MVNSDLDLYAAGKYCRANDAPKEAAMKALSIRQPWADCIIHHGKDIENRDWHTRFRGKVYVHAAKKWGPDERQTQENLAEELDWQDVGQPLLGGIIGTVEIVDCVEHSDSWWFMGRYGFVLRDPQPLEFIPCRGALGFFTPDLTPPDPKPEKKSPQGQLEGTAYARRSAHTYPH